MTIEDFHIGKTNDITLLTATIDEVGRNAHAFRIFSVRYAASLELFILYGRLYAFDLLTHDDAGVAIYIALHTIAGAIDIEAGEFRIGSKRIVGCFQLLLVLASQKVALQMDGYVASYRSGIEATAIDASALVGTIHLLRCKLVLDGEVDEWFLRVSLTEQIATLVGNLSVVVVVGIVASSYNLFGDGKTLREGIIHHLALSIRIDIHVTTVTAAEEGADGTLGQVILIYPFQCSLDIHLYRLEIEVDEVRIDQWALLALGREIQGTDTTVGWIVHPVDAVGKVQLLAGIIVIAIQLLELVHEVVVLGCGKEGIAIATHKESMDVDIAANLDVDATAGGIRRLGLGILHLQNGGRVTAAIDITLDEDGIVGILAGDMDIHLVGQWSPGIDVHHLGCIASRLVRRHAGTHRYGEYQWRLFRTWVVRIERIVLVDGYLGVALSVEGIEVIAVAGTIDIAVDMTAIDVDLRTLAAIVGEIAVGIVHVDISGNIIASEYVAVNEDILVGIGASCRFASCRSASCRFALRRGCSIVVLSDIHLGTQDDITHHTASEDVTAVHRLDIYMRSLDGIVETATEESATEGTALTGNEGFTFYLTGVATAHEVHHGISAPEVLVLLTRNQVDGWINLTATTLHGDIHIGVTPDDGMFAIAATEYAEVRGSHLIIYLLPFVGIEEVRIFLLSGNHLGGLVEQSLCHGEVGVAAYDACHITTGIDVVVDLELQVFMVVLWRVVGVSHFCCRLPGTGLRTPIGGKQGFTAINQYIGAAGDICRCDSQ